MSEPILSRVPDQSAADHCDESLINSVAQLAQIAANVDFTVEDMLQTLCLVVARTLRIAGEGVSDADGGGVRFMHAARGRAVAVQRYRASIATALSPPPPIPPAILGSDSPWAGLRPVTAMPLVARGYAWGMLDLYRAGACSWSEHDLALARLYVDIAASYIALADERDREQKARRELEHRVTHDELTGLPNRGLLFDRLEHAVLAASRHLRTVAVLFVDIDDFKEINDALGHAFGDTVLVEVSRRLGLTLRANDTLARLAGDEFVVICEDLTGSPIQIDRWLHALGRRIQLTLRQPPIVWQTEIMLSVSIGAAVTTQGRGARELISDADRAMYVAKQRGGGRLVISKRNDGSSTRRRADRDLARAQEPRPESRS